MIGTKINGYTVIATGITARDTSVLLGLNETEHGDRYVVATIDTESTLAEEPPTYWSSGHYTSNLVSAVTVYLNDLETDPLRFEKLVAQIERDRTGRS